VIGSVPSGPTVKGLNTFAGRAGGPARSRCEVPAGTVGGGAKGQGRPWLCLLDQPGRWPGRGRVDELKSKVKPFDISKREVWEAFLQVRSDQGAAGVNGQSIAEFETDLKDNRRIQPVVATPRVRRC
jgi:hypothetical protein